MKSLKLSSLVLLIPILSFAHGPILELAPYEVTGRAAPLIGDTISSSQGIVHQSDLELRPLLRTGEILETIPGFIATQHSGTGKGNQFFLRGFNLDHGTDFGTFVDGMPVNLPTHGHGQGYTDINFVIPELVDTIVYSKGPYYAAVGDFGSAGAGHISTVDTLGRGLSTLTIGEDSYLRGVLADSVQTENGSFLGAVELHYMDGPWDIGENLNKFNTLLKHTGGSDSSRYGVTFMGYDSEWDSADQIPRRAVESGLISDLGSLDTDLGGTSSRFSLSGDYTRVGDHSLTQANLYAIYYDLSLWSNFTYFLDDPVNGDEFEQVDERMIYGGSFSYTYFGEPFMGGEMRHTTGVQLRYDDINGVGLFKSAGRERISTVREDDVRELSLGAFYENEIQWNDQLKTIFGIRADYFSFDVDSNLAANSGSENDARVSPKISLVYSVNQDVEWFISAGYGFHSNDARGTTITVDPTDGVTPAEQVDPIVKSEGAEVGARFTWNEKLNTSMSLWLLQLDSELLFVGDAGITEASRPSRRYGFEIANFFTPTEGLTFELDVSLTEAQFRDNDPAGDDVPGAVNAVVSAAVTYENESGWISSLRLRHFGPRSLIEDGSVESDGTSIFNLRTGYRAENWAVFLDVLNLFDSSDDDITYFYESRLPGEPDGGVADEHFHPIEPRSLRATFSWRF